MAKTTQRDVLNTILEAMGDNTDVVDYCTKALAALDKKAEKSAEKSAEKDAVYATLRADAKDILAGSTDGMTVTDILKAGAWDDVTNQKLTYALRKPVENGEIVKKTVKGKVYYSLVVAD